jgi:hypothetical protein
MQYKEGNQYWYLEEDKNPVKVTLLSFDYLSPTLPCFIQHVVSRKGDFGFKRLYCEANQLRDVTEIELAFEAIIEALRDTNTKLVEDISTIQTKHQEELGNYNSVAAADMENRYQEAIQSVSTEWDKWKHALVITNKDAQNDAPIALIEAFQISLKDINID